MAEESRKLLPSVYELRWADTWFRIHNATWFLCELLQRFKTLQTPVTNITAALNDSVQMLVEVACKSADDVCILDSLHCLRLSHILARVVNFTEI